MSRECSFILSATDLEVSPMYAVVQSLHEFVDKLACFIFRTWVSGFPIVFVEANATRIPSGLSVLLIAFEIFGT